LCPVDLAEAWLVDRMSDPFRNSAPTKASTLCERTPFTAPHCSGSGILLTHSFLPKVEY